jgi:hypothetical protein
VVPVAYILGCRKLVAGRMVAYTLVVADTLVVHNPSACIQVGIEPVASSVAFVASVAFASSVVVAYILEHTMEVVGNLGECTVGVACTLVEHSWLACILVDTTAS